MSDHPAYRTYWQRKEMLRRGHPASTLKRWWQTDGLCDIEQVYFDAVRGAKNLLDVGAGDLRIMRKFQRAGFAGEYHTQDVGAEGTHTYGDLSEVRRTYDAVVCLDVVEHLALADGLSLIDKMLALLAPNGVFVLQTANPAYLPDPRSWDMTHVHLYSLHDLHAYLSCEGLDVRGYRFEMLDRERESALRGLKRRVTAYVKTNILGCDHAAGIALIAQKTG